MWSKLRATFHVEIAQRLDQAFLARKNFLWSSPAHIRPNNATFAARFEQTKTPACETLAPKRTHAKRKYAAPSTRKENAQNAGRQSAGIQNTGTQNAGEQNAGIRNAGTQSERMRGSPKTIIAIAPLASPARFPPFRQEHRAENEPRNSQRRKNAERHAEAVRIDAQIAARSERHDPDKHRRKQRA